MKYYIQSILIRRTDYTVDQAFEWIEVNNFKIKKLELWSNYFRFKQNDMKSNTLYRIVSVDSSNILFVLGYNLSDCLSDDS